MNRCPITYEEIAGGTYSEHGLYLLSRRLIDLSPFPYTAGQQRREAARQAAKMSIQGVQPKLNVHLNISSQVFDLVDYDGSYIVKPPGEVYPELPQNEDVTMRMAALAGIKTPLHGLFYACDGSLTYFVKRFDRTGRDGKLALEDFAQIQGKTRETKYCSSMEHVAATIRAYCTFPVLEFVKLFRLVLFNFLVGNEEMHLKKFSLLCRDGQVGLSPAYGLRNTTIALGSAGAELALPLRGKRQGLKSEDFFGYFGRELLHLPQPVIDGVLRDFSAAKEHWCSLLNICFLSHRMKEAYTKLLHSRVSALGL